MKLFQKYVLEMYICGAVISMDTRVECFIVMWYVLPYINMRRDIIFAWGQWELCSLRYPTKRKPMKGRIVIIGVWIDN